MSKLSLAIILKNEEHYLKQCIESVAPIVSEIVAVDSGSKDLTIQILQDFSHSWRGSVKITHRKWPDNFSDQRNFALSQVTGDWTLVLDADECILPAEHAKLKAAMNDTSVQAYCLTIRNYTPDPTEFGYQRDPNGPYPQHGFVETNLHRLFQNKPEIRYEGILHERVEPSLERMNANTKPLEVTIHHFGKLKEKDLHLEQSRYQFYEGLARKKVAANSEDAQAHWELGVVLQKQRRFDDALLSFHKAHQLAPHVEEFENYVALALFQRGDWNGLSQIEAQSTRAKAFKTLAEVQSDPQKISALDCYRNEISQMNLFIFELALKHKLTDRIDSDRKAAMDIFGSTGVVEYLEGVQRRRELNFAEAVRLLKEAYGKGWKRAALELLIALNQQSQFREALDFAEGMSANDRNAFGQDFETLYAYAKSHLR